MKLIVSGLDAAPIKFKHLWGRYVVGFKPWTHCIQCFESHIAKMVSPTMSDGEYELNDAYPLLYLCGVGQDDLKRNGAEFKQGRTNVHLPVRPRKGSVAATGSVYGVTFTITDAEAIPIQSLPDNFQGLPAKHARCKNFQFGYQMFNVDRVDGPVREIVRELRPLV